MYFSAFLLADQVYQDGASGKFILAGTFHMMRVEKVPAQFPKTVGLFVSCCGFEGNLEWHLRFISPSNEELGKRGVLVTSPSKESYIEFALEIPILPLPESGTYTFVFEDSSQKQLAKTTFEVILYSPD